MSDSTQGNGAPGASQGNGAPGASQGEGEKPQGLTLEDVNRAITGRLKAFETTFTKSVETALGGVVQKLDESFTQKLEGLKPKDPEPAPDPKAKKGTSGETAAPAIEEHPLVKSLMQQVATLTKKADQAEATSKAERAKARDISLRNTVVSALTTAGIPASHARKAVFELIDGTKRISYESDDSDALRFRGDDGEHVDFETGLKGWLGSDDAKIYRPATGAAGSGDRPGTKGNAQPPATDGKANLEQLTREYFGLG